MNSTRPDHAWPACGSGRLMTAHGLALLAVVIFNFVSSAATRVVSWGALGVPEPGGQCYTKIVAGGVVSAAIRCNGTITVWGDGHHGQTHLPTAATNVVDLALGKYSSYGHCLAARRDGAVVAWGANQFGQSDVPAGLSRSEERRVGKECRTR